MSDPAPRDGALRFKAEDGEWIVANPRDLLYSTVTMQATEYYSDGQWKPILGLED